MRRMVAVLAGALAAGAGGDAGRGHADVDQPSPVPGSRLAQGRDAREGILENAAPRAVRTPRIKRGLPRPLSETDAARAIAEAGQKAKTAKSD